MLLTNYKHTQPTLGLSVTFVFNIECLDTYKVQHVCNLSVVNSLITWL